MNVVSTFCGCGGSSLGYKLAGCKVVLATDYEERAIKTYQLNFPDTKTLISDIRNLTGKQIKQITGLKEIDILDGSPPCTPFSLAGHRQKKWGTKYVGTAMTHAQRTDDLFFEFIRLIKEVNPKIFLAENVKGLIIGKAKGYYNLILQEMRKLNYNVEPYILNAKYYQVPQARERIVFIGYRKDLKLNDNLFLNRYKPITVREAIAQIQSDELELEKSTNAFTHSIHYNDYIKLKEGQAHPDHFNYMRLSYDKPSNTITAHCDHEIIHPVKHRFITLTEAKALCTFPLDFKFLSIMDGYKRLGNSVPPNLIKNIILYVMQKIDRKGISVSMS